MHDTFLFKKISETLFEICKESGIEKITYLEVEVNTCSHVSSPQLLEHLLEEIPELVSYDTKIKVNKHDKVEPLIAIIQSVEGALDETDSD